ncbi:MAG: 2-C-methyl-D-erythritol 4-phosphate cytidylyltransferase [Gemmatimonadota bacterium]
MNIPEIAEDRELPTLGVAIPAAGTGTRMGGVRKPFVELCGEPLLLHSLRPFLEHPQVHAVAIALGEEDFLDPPEWLGELGSRVLLVRGGASRGESVWAALQALPSWVELVAVHDAARPLVTRSIIDRCLREVRGTRGAVAGWPAVDTLKRVGEGERVAETLPRDEVWHAQTPQIFPREMIFRAYEEAALTGVSNTDDSALVERAGGEVVMVRGSPFNLKVTRSEDLALAEYFLRLEAR